MYWESKRRLALLRQFRLLASDYFENIEYVSWMAGGAPPNMNVKAQKARSEINRMMGDVVLSFDLLGIPHVVFYQPPPITGGYAQNLDVILNTFNLYSFDLPTEKVFDCTDAAIGAYERECQKLLRKSFNPFYWLGMLIVWVLRLPFKLFAAAGFDTTSVEASFFGKTLKLVWGLALGLAAFIPAVWETVDHWDKLLKWLATLHF